MNRSADRSSRRGLGGPFLAPSRGCGAECTDACDRCTANGESVRAPARHANPRACNPACLQPAAGPASNQAGHGADALALATRHEGDIHLLVTDVIMPNMPSKEVADKIRLLRPDIAVLHTLRHVQPVPASQSRLDRDANLIEKPFTAATPGHQGWTDTQRSR